MLRPSCPALSTCQSHGPLSLLSPRLSFQPTHQSPMGPYSFAASVGSSVQALTAVWKLESVSAAHSVLREVVQAFAMLVERRAKTTAKFVYFMTVVIGEGVGGRGELSYELGNAWRAMHGGIISLMRKTLQKIYCTAYCTAYCVGECRSFDWVFVGQLDTIHLTCSPPRMIQRCPPHPIHTCCAHLVVK